MSFLGVDFGTRCLGLALGQEVSKGNFAVSPIAPLLGRETDLLLKNLKRVCQEYAVETAVFGLPYLKDGREAPLSGKIRQFGQEFAMTYNRDFPRNRIKLEFTDESLTSFEATSLSQQTSGTRQKKREDLNSLAAVLILENYLNRLGNDS